MHEYMRIAAKTGRLYTGGELSEKFWLKMPGDLGKRIKEAFEEKYPGVVIGVMPRILFAYRYLEGECKDAAYKRSLKDLSFCSQIPIPGYYKTERKYGVRPSRTYKGKPHTSHVRIEKRKHLVREKKCRCYLCGQEGHFARECPNEKRNVKRVAVFEQLDVPDDFEILSVHDGEDQSDAIFSVSEGEEGTATALKSCIQNEHIYMLGEIEEDYRPQVRLPDKQMNCLHKWELNSFVQAKFEACACCKRKSMQRARIHCPTCSVTACNLCGPH